MAKEELDEHSKDKQTENWMDGH